MSLTVHDVPYSERVITTVSGAEQKRRWAAVRTAMEEDGVDALVFHNLTDTLPGYVRWISDMWHEGGYPVSIVFPRDEDMTVIFHGPKGFTQDIDPHDNPILHGAKRIMRAPSFVSVSYTQLYDAERIAEALAPYRRGTIGVVGPAQLPFPIMDHLRSEFDGAAFVDFSPRIDAIKSLKSDEEITAIRRAARMQDEAFQAALGIIRPGLSETDLAAFLSDYVFRAGSENGLIMIGSGPEGDAVMFGPRRYQNRVMNEGDSITLLLERTGPEGVFTELGRTLVIGEAPQKMLDEYEFLREAQDFAVSLLVPGAKASELAEQYNDFLREHGRPEETRLFCHGQGYDIVERPLIREDEPMVIAPRMNIAVHPAYALDGRAYWTCDNWILDEDGEAVRIHETERRIFECV